MSYKRHMTLVKGNYKAPTERRHDRESRGGAASAYRFSSTLPETYSGHPNRTERYFQYDDMDYDSEVNAALDTLADFCTQSEEQNRNPFQFFFASEANETETKLLKDCLDEWVKLNRFRSYLWYIFRNTIKYGDQFFIRDPETFQWLWVDHVNLVSILVDDAQGKKPQHYLIKDLDINMEGKVATSVADRGGFGASYFPNVPGPNSVMGGQGTNAGSQGPWSSAAPNRRDSNAGNQWNSEQNAPSAVEAKNMIHLSLNVGMDANWPFGNSVLDAVFKPYKQKSLLEDSVIIYRIVRAPERRVFYIDVGNMNAQRAMAHVERVRNEIHQRRIPNRTGGGNSILDASYNPLSMGEDYFLAQSTDGRSSKIETLPGGDNLGDIDDLKFFDQKMLAALRIPAAYRISGSQENGAVYNDGKVGTALIQEFRFNKYCMRIQSLMQPVFDKEFKLFVKWKGLDIDPSIYEVMFNPPQNFTKYREIELQAAQTNVFGAVASYPFISKEFAMIKWLGMTEDEIEDNMTKWAQENADRVKTQTGGDPEGTGGGDLSSVGIRSGGDDIAGMDVGGGEELPDEDLEAGTGGPGVAAGNAGSEAGAAGGVET